MPTITPAKDTLIERIGKLFPETKDKEVTSILNDVHRFVNTTKNIYNEPQATVTYIDRKIKKKKGREETEKVRVFNTDSIEINKARKNVDPNTSFIDLIKETHERFTKKK